MNAIKMGLSADRECPRRVSFSCVHFRVFQVLAEQLASVASALQTEEEGQDESVDLWVT